MHRYLAFALGLIVLVVILAPSLDNLTNRLAAADANADGNANADTDTDTEADADADANMELRVGSSAELTLKMFCQWKNRILVDQEFDLAVLVTR